LRGSHAYSWVVEGDIEACFDYSGFHSSGKT
jgi:retron-type reverse transcriptase